MIKNCYFAVSAADGTAGDEEIACCNAAFFSHMEAETATTTALFFNTSQEIGKDTPTTKIVLTHTGVKHGVFLKALAEATNQGPHSDGITIIADDYATTYLTSDITAVASITVASQV